MRESADAAPATREATMKRPWPAVLKVDIDLPHPRRRVAHVRRLAWLLHRAAMMWGFDVRRAWVLRTRKGVHLVAWVDPPPESPWALIALQAILGSDPVREILNGYRVANRWPTWNVAFGEKRVGGRPVSREEPDAGLTRHFLAAWRRCAR